MEVQPLKLEIAEGGEPPSTNISALKNEISLSADKGGSLNLRDRVELTIPPGVLEEDAKITIKEIKGGLPLLFLKIIQKFLDDRSFFVVQFAGKLLTLKTQIKQAKPQTPTFKSSTIVVRFYHDMLLVDSQEGGDRCGSFFWKH